MVVPPFGFGVGDFLAVAKLTGKIVSELKDNGEATSKYQDLIIELESLERALSRLYTLKPAEHELVHLDAIRAAATTCKRPLESFLAKIEKFEKRLGVQNAKDNQFKGAGRRIQFNVAFEEDVKELRTTLASHVLTINTLLTTQLLDSITTAESARADHVENLKSLFEAHAPLLQTIIGKVSEVSIDLDSYKENMGALWERVDQLQIPDSGTSVNVDDQQRILEAIRLEIRSVLENVVAKETNAKGSNPTEPVISNSSSPASTITSGLVALLLSGTVIASTQKLANQARDLSMIARKLEIHVPPAEQLLDRPSISSGGPAGRAKQLTKSCCSAVTDPIDLGQPSIAFDARTYTSEGYEKSLAAACCSQEGRTGKLRETPHQGKDTKNQTSSSCGLHLRSEMAKQSDIYPDEQPWNLIWESSTALPVEKNPVANEKKQPSTDTSVRIPTSSKPLLRGQPPIQMQDSLDSSDLACRFPGCEHVCALSHELKSHPKTHFPPLSIGGASYVHTGGQRCRGRASKLSLSRSGHYNDGLRRGFANGATMGSESTFSKRLPAALKAKVSCVTAQHDRVTKSKFSGGFYGSCRHAAVARDYCNSEYASRYDHDRQKKICVRI